MNHQEEFRQFQKSGKGIDSFVLESSRMGNLLYYIVASVSGKTSVIFEQKEIVLPSQGAVGYSQEIRDILEKIRETTMLISQQQLKLVADKLMHSIGDDPASWELGNATSEDMKKRA